MSLMTEKREILAPAPPGRGHRPCHSAVPGSGPAGGPKPPASARPAQRFSPAGSGAGLCFSLTDRSARHRRARAGETRVAFPVPARTDDSALTASMAGAIAPATAQGWHQDRPGAQSPRPAPIPPPAGASHPPGRALASVPSGPAGLRGAVPRGRGKRDAFPDPARTDDSAIAAPMAGAIALGPAQRRDQDGLGAKAPAPPPAGAGLCFSRPDRSGGHPSAHRGNPFPGPAKPCPAAHAARPPLQHPVRFAYGPCPLPWHSRHRLRLARGVLRARPHIIPPRAASLARAFRRFPVPVTRSAFPARQSRPNWPQSGRPVHGLQVRQARLPSVR